MQITLTIPDAKLKEFKAGFLAMYPVPLIEDPENPDHRIPAFTEAGWFREWLKREAMKAYKCGKRKLAQKAAQINERIVE